MKKQHTAIVLRIYLFVSIVIVEDWPDSVSTFIRYAKQWRAFCIHRFDFFNYCYRYGKKRILERRTLLKRGANSYANFSCH